MPPHRPPLALPTSIFPNGVLKTTAGCDGHELWKANPSREARNGLRADAVAGVGNGGGSRVGRGGHLMTPVVGSFQ